MQLAATGQTIETPRHEMPPAVFFQQAALAHVHACGQCHQVVRVLDGTVALRVFKLLVLVATDAVEFQQPMVKALTCGDLPGAHFVGIAVPGDHRLGARAASRGADAQDVLQCIGAACVGKRSRKVVAPAQHVGRQLHQGIDVDFFRNPRSRPGCRRKLKRPHATCTGIAKPLHRIEARRRATLCGQPRIDQRIPELVGQRIRQQARQTVKRAQRQRGKGIHAVAQWHGDGRHLDAARRKCRRVLKCCGRGAVVQRNRTNGPAP